MQRDRLFEEIHRADPRRFGGRVDGCVTGQQDHRHRQQAITLPFLEQRHAISIRHPNVEQYQIRRIRQADLAGRIRIFCCRDDMTLIAEDFGQQLPDAHFVVNDQNICHGCASSTHNNGERRWNCIFYNDTCQIV